VPGPELAARTILPLGVALLGARIPVEQVQELRPAPSLAHIVVDNWP
jgi:uncharacterized membrane protein YadS